jgi:competence protein ComGC
MDFESFRGIIQIIMVIIVIATLILVYFIYRLIKKNQKLIDKEQSQMIKDVKSFLKK